MQLRQRGSLLAERETKVAIVTFEQAWRAAKYLEETQFPWPMLLDSDRKLYQAYGMDRGTTHEVMGLHNWAMYLKLLWRGRRLHRPTDDIYQLGGDVLIDQEGIVRIHHVARGPGERLPVDELLQRT